MKRLNSDGSVAGLLIGILILVILAGALIPTIFDSVTDMTEDADTNLGNDTYWDGTSHLDLGPSVALIDLWPILVVIGVMLAILAIAL